MNASSAGKAIQPNTGQAIRDIILSGDWPVDTAKQTPAKYRRLSKTPDVAVAVQSRATLEYLSNASCVGRQETFLSVIEEVGLLAVCRKCYASLFTQGQFAIVKLSDCHMFNWLCQWRAADGSRGHGGLGKTLLRWLWTPTNTRYSNLFLVIIVNHPFLNRRLTRKSSRRSTTAMARHAIRRPLKPCVPRL